jgi:hypothetical protein
MTDILYFVDQINDQYLLLPLYWIIGQLRILRKKLTINLVNKV